MTESAPEIITVGETMALVAPARLEPLASARQFTVSAAGAESNVARYLADLGHRVAWASRLGRDPLGDRVFASIEASGIDTRWIARDSDAPTGVYFKDPSPQATPVYYYRSGSAASRLSVTDVEALPISTARLVHTTGITLALSSSAADAVRELVRVARDGGVHVAFDVNFRPKLWAAEQAGPVIAEVARSSDTVFVGLDEAEALWGTASPDEVRALLGAGCELVIKDSGRKVTSYAAGSSVAVLTPVTPVEVVEPVGAGDAFAAGYLSGIVRGLPLVRRVELAHALASLVLTSLEDHVNAGAYAQWHLSIASHNA